MLYFPLTHVLFLFYLLFFFFCVSSFNFVLSTRPVYFDWPATADEKENCSSSEPSIRFKNGVPYHSVDLSASCPRCLAAAAEKPGSEGEFIEDMSQCPAYHRDTNHMPVSRAHPSHLHQLGDGGTGTAKRKF